MLKMDIKRLKLVLISTCIFGLLAHGYCYFNFIFSHDSVMVSQYGDINWKIAIGRWCQPYYFAFRGYVYNPFLVGIISLLFLSLACYLLILTLVIRDVVSTIFICGVLATNSVMIVTNATFIHEIDVFMLAFLCSVSGVYVYKRYRYGFILSTILFAFSLGLYQAFIQTAILLFMFLILKDLLDNLDYLTVIKKGGGVRLFDCCWRADLFVWI